MDHSKSGVDRIGIRKDCTSSTPHSAENRAWTALTEVPWRAGLTDNRPQDIARLRVHRAAMFGCPRAEAAFHIIVKIPNRYAGHGIPSAMSELCNDSKAIKPKSKFLTESSPTN